MEFMDMMSTESQRKLFESNKKVVKVSPKIHLMKKVIVKMNNDAL